MDEPKDTLDNPASPSPSKPLLCSCTQDPFSDLPPELRPHAKIMGDLRKVTCPGCGLVYWTNRKTDLCIECEKKDAHLLETDTSIP
jgi:hypothetical protein